MMGSFFGESPIMASTEFKQVISTVLLQELYASGKREKTRENLQGKQNTCGGYDSRQEWIARMDGWPVCI